MQESRCNTCPTIAQFPILVKSSILVWLQLISGLVTDSLACYDKAILNAFNGALVQIFLQGRKMDLINTTTHQRMCGMQQMGKGQQYTHAANRNGEGI